MPRFPVMSLKHLNQDHERSGGCGGMFPVFSFKNSVQSRCVLHSKVKVSPQLTPGSSRTIELYLGSTVTLYHYLGDDSQNHFDPENRVSLRQMKGYPAAHYDYDEAPTDEPDDPGTPGGGDDPGGSGDLPFPPLRPQLPLPPDIVVTPPQGEVEFLEQDFWYCPKGTEEQKRKECNEYCVEQGSKVGQAWEGHLVWFKELCDGDCTCNIQSILQF